MRTGPIVCAIAATSTLAFFSGCNNDSTFPTANPGGSSGGATILITRTGLSPQSVSIVAGAQVTFVNSDSLPREIRSDPHPGHGDCPEINQVGVIQPGNNRQTGNLTVVRTCGFHDDRESPTRDSITIR